MILVTVGAQMPFDRLVGAVDAWAARVGRDDVFAQIGPRARRPRHIEWCEFLDPPAYRRRCERADAIVAHAGMGSILTALELAKPLIIMPRRGELRETRNDHQVATARRFCDKPGVFVAMDVEELEQRLERIDELAAGEAIAPVASPELLAAVRAFIYGDLPHA
ncbi:MAG: glycosyl transferase family 28 [Planctomycetota bacterium]|nr:MAG: glycosyl transferase family 28 [Planctomycetota bacterium]